MCTPHISCNTTGSDSATVWFDIWDSQKGANAIRLVNHHIQICGWHATIRKTVMHPGLAQCRCCWRWGHPTHKCRFLRLGERCAKCFGTHRTENHRVFAMCCKANPKANPPTKGTSASLDCPHAFRCVNCGGNHAADDVKCVYFKHRFDHPWHQRRAEEVKEDLCALARRNFRYVMALPDEGDPLDSQRLANPMAEEAQHFSDSSALATGSQDGVPFLANAAALIGGATGAGSSS